MSGPRIGSLFSGYGGLDMAVTAILGGSTAWVSDIDKGACKILAHRYPDAPNLGDIADIKWTPDCPACGDLLALYWNDSLPEGRGYYCPTDGWFPLSIWDPESGVAEPVEVLSGGFPCQDVSAAGKRAGIRPGTRSGLWSQFAYAISQLRPSLVVIENVRGLLSASAHSNLEPCPWCVGEGPGVHLRALGAVLGDLADLGYDAAWHGVRAADVGAPHGRFRVFITAWPAAPDADVSGRCGLWWVDPVQRDADGRAGQDGLRQEGQPSALLPTPSLSDSNRGAQHADLRRGHTVNLIDAVATVDRWGDYASAIARWETHTRRAPSPTERGARGGMRMAARFSEWMMGVPDGWITDVPGITRNEALKACGNGVVPQQAEAALRWLLPLMAEAVAA